MPAPKGNTNALKHGLYARHIRIDEQERLTESEEDLSGEIKMLRVILDRLLEQIKDKTEYSEKDMEAIRLITTVSLTIGTLTSRRAFLTGKVNGVEQAVEEAIRAEAPMWGKA